MGSLSEALAQQIPPEAVSFLGWGGGRVRVSWVAILQTQEGGGSQMSHVTQESPEASGGFFLHPGVLCPPWEFTGLSGPGIIYQERILNCKSGSVTRFWMLPDSPITL